MNIISIHSAPRSGSTWLQAILESHPNIVTKYQPLFSYAFKNIINVNSTADEFNKFINDLCKSDDPFVNSKSNFHINNNINMPKYEKNNIATLVMKNVHHHNLIETFIKLHPSIKIIGLIRHPYAVINSLIHNINEYKQEWLETNEWLTGKHKNIDQYHYWGYLKWKEVNNIFQYIREHYPDNIYILKYEDLIDDPINELNNLFIYLDLPMTDSVIDYINKKSNDIKSDYGLNKSYIVRNKWVSQLPDNILQYIKNDTYINYFNQ